MTLRKIGFLGKPEGVSRHEAGEGPKEGHTQSPPRGAFLPRETGVSPNSITNWVEAYQAHGEAGLQNRPRASKAKTAQSTPVAAKIVELKRDNPNFGVKRISQFLRRMFFLEASPFHLVPFGTRGHTPCQISKIQIEILRVTRRDGWPIGFDSPYRYQRR